MDHHLNLYSTILKFTNMFFDHCDTFSLEGYEGTEHENKIVNIGATNSAEEVLYYRKIETVFDFIAKIAAFPNIFLTLGGLFLSNYQNFVTNIEIIKEFKDKRRIRRKGSF